MICDRRTVGDNGPLDTSLPPFVHDWNSRYAYPHIVLATTSQMFHDFAARYGKTLPTVHGDYTGYWEDGAASTAPETAITAAPPNDRAGRDPLVHAVPETVSVQRH